MVCCSRIRIFRVTLPVIARSCVRVTRSSIELFIIIIIFLSTHFSIFLPTRLGSIIITFCII